MSSSERIILITGASSGIGAATARALAAPDTAIVLHARKNRAGLEKVADAVRGAGAETAILEGDLSQPGTAQLDVSAVQSCSGGRPSTGHSSVARTSAKPRLSPQPSTHRPRAASCRQLSTPLTHRRAPAGSV